MNKRDAQKWKKALNEERSKLTEQLRNVEQGLLKKSQRDSTGDLSGYSFHMADVGTDNFDRDVSLAHASTDQRIVYEVDEALKRIDEGTYGICQACNRQIKKDRLKAVPYARLCIQCKSKEESQPRTSGDPSGPAAS